MKRVVSYCLYGGAESNPSRYWGLAQGVVWAHCHIFSGWELRIYHDENLKEFGGYLPGYEQAGLVTLVQAAPNDFQADGMIWRFKPIWEPDVEYVLVRDMDSLPMVRDRKMVEEFIRSKRAAHAISDHPSHAWPLLGGTSGFYVPQFLHQTRLESWDALLQRSKEIGIELVGRFADQNVLGFVVWPLVSGSVCEHRLHGVRFTCYGGDGQVSVTPFIGGGPSFDRVPDLCLEGLPFDLEQSFDLFSPFLGYTGFDQAGVIKFLKEHGHPEVTARLLAAENF